MTLTENLKKQRPPRETGAAVMFVVQYLRYYREDMNIDQLINFFSLHNRRIKSKQLLVIPIILSGVFITLLIANRGSSDNPHILLARKAVIQSEVVEELVGKPVDISFGENTMFRNDTLYYQPRVTGPKGNAEILCVLYTANDSTGRVISIAEDKGRFRREGANSKWLIDYKAIK